MTTIRLSDRLTIEHSAEAGCHARLTNYKESITDDLCEAIVALANPPRYDLPTGVIHGSDGKFYAPGDVVRTLPDEMWSRHNGHGRSFVDFNAGAWASDLYEVRPTAANPLQSLPDHTFRLPDGELACYRRDAAKLREAGATLTTTTDGDADDWFVDAAYPDQVLLVEFPEPPKTDEIDTRLSVGRLLPDGTPIIAAGEGETGRWYRTKSAPWPAEFSATVTVLAADGAA